jgi:hypothetical protein
MCNVCDEVEARKKAAIREAMLAPLIHVDYRTATALVRAAVAVRGEDYVYPRDERGGCDYVHCDTPESGKEVLIPGCIVGQVVYMAGIPLSRFRDIGGTLSGNRESFRSVGIVFTDKAADFLNWAQGLQDRGKTWQEAYSGAVTRTKEDRYDDNEARDA